ncbi:tetratricopeptide repeat protein [Pseudorhodoplanes sp.]|uniref:tetratricopeptide repeat protein n=1 Tax=Pseudorhodoplanes sp. TaxID=1934341 RepID=UPI00391BA1E6
MSSPDQVSLEAQRTSLNLRILGPCQITVGPDRQPFHLKNKKARGLLAYLAMQPLCSAQRTTLANLFWPDCPEGNARHSLRQCLVSLRKDLDAIAPGLVRTDGDTISLDPERIEADAAMLLRVENLSDRANLHALLLSVRGEFLSDLHVNEDFSNWSSELRQRVHHKLEELIGGIENIQVSDELTSQALATIRILAKTDPYCETCRRLLIRLTARVQGRARALAECKAFVDFLREENLDGPDPETQELFAEIQRLPCRTPSAANAVRDPQAEHSGHDAPANRSDEVRSDVQRAGSAPPAPQSVAEETATARGPAAPPQRRDAVRAVKRFSSMGIRMAAAAALFIALVLLLQTAERFGYFVQAEATSVSGLLAEAQQDPLFESVSIAVRRFPAADPAAAAAEQLHEMIADTVAKVPMVRIVTSSGPAPARYILDGSVKSIAGSEALFVELSQPDGDVLWREKFNIGASEAAKAEVAKRIAREVELTLVKAETRSAIARNDVSARALLLSARAIKARGISSGAESDAQKLYETLLARDGLSAPVLAGLSGHIITSLANELKADAALYRRAENYLRAAISIDPNMAIAHFYMGMLQKSRGQAAEAAMSFNRAIELNPSFAPAYANLGHALLLLGRPDEAAENVRKAMRISPNDGYFAVWSLFAGEIEFERGNVDAAIDWFRTAIVRGPHLTRPYGWIAGAYEAAGNHAAAAENMRQFLTLAGERRPHRLVERLRKAPEGGLHLTRPKLFQAVAAAAQRQL